MEDERRINVSTIAETLAEQVCDYRMEQAEHQETLNRYRPAINKPQPDWHKDLYRNATRWHGRIQERINAVVAAADGLGIYKEFNEHLEALDEVHGV